MTPFYRKQADHNLVLIAGAGPVGLAMACELGSRGIDCILVERRDGSVSVPKMSFVSSRNMEFCRRWGIAQEVRSAVWPDSHALDIVYLESLKGREMARVKIPSYKDRRLDFTPEGACHCPQIYFEPILSAHVRAMKNVAIRYRTSLDSFSQEPDGIHAQLTDHASGEKSAIRARYLVGCDGPAGIVRDTLGIGLGGLGVVARSLNIFFRSTELSTLHDKGWARIYRAVDEDGCWSELIPINGHDLWRLTVFNDEPASSDPDRYLTKLAGIGFSYELLSVMPWERRDFVAEHFGVGRVFIAGDAAHQCSPTAGMGMHMGIEDAVNLGWKIAAVLQGWGGPHLLASYELERRAIDNRNVALSTRSFQEIMSVPGWNEREAGPTGGNDDPRLADWRRHLGKLSGNELLKIQYCYENSPVCVPDGTPPVDYDMNRFTPTTRPGTRAPHAWMADGRSTLDLFGHGFTLLRFGAEARDAAALLDAARKANVPIVEQVIEDSHIAAIYERKLVLVRPDGHVAWRGDCCPDDAQDVIAVVRGNVAATAADERISNRI